MSTKFKVQFRENEFGYEIDELQIDLDDKDMLATEIENHLSSRARHDHEHISVVVSEWGEAIVYSLDDEVGRADIVG